MAIRFYKYQGAGNDFVIIDDRDGAAFHGIGPEPGKVAFLCDRHFGIGADGLILIRQSDCSDFTMTYFNADGKEGSFCGNGSRCAVAFAKKMAIIEMGTTFMAADGLHQARILNEDQMMVSIHMNDVVLQTEINDNLILDTGSPHLVIFSGQVAEMDAESKGRAIRNSAPYALNGINVNFVEISGDDSLFVRTYERGVERETLSCGTGVTASAIAAWMKNFRNHRNSYHILTPGGQLNVSFKPPSTGNNIMTDIWLTGLATFVYTGEITI